MRKKLLLLFIVAVDMLPFVATEARGIIIGPRCETYYSDGEERLFSDYQSQEYDSNGLLRIRFKMTPDGIYNDGRTWAGAVEIYDAQCNNLKLFGDRIYGNVSLPAGTADFSLRFITPTHFQLWNDGANQLVSCPFCDVDFSSDNLGDNLKAHFFGSMFREGIRSDDGMFWIKESEASTIDSDTFPITGPNYVAPNDPVIIIPGIMGSQLSKNYGDKTEIWPNADTMALSLSDDFLNDLALEGDGSENPDKPMAIGDIIRSVTGHLLFFSSTSHIFDGLITELEANGYTEDDNLFVFPYDWRKGSAENAIALKNKIEAIMASTSAEKIDIIAHSMGGLVAKEYIAKNGADAINRLIFIGTPQLGAPLAFKALMYGDDMGVKIGFLSLLSPNRVKTISQNMPSVFELLPSKKYVDQLEHPYVRDLVTESETKSCSAFNLSYASTTEFMIDEGRNKEMFSFAETLHQSTDNLDLSSVKTYSIIGYTGPTVGFITAKKKKTRTIWGGVKITDDFELGYVSGDQTVPLASARDGAGRKYYIEGVKHSNLPSAEEVKKTIISILKGKNDEDIAVIVTGGGATTTAPSVQTLSKLPGVAVSVHATSTMNIYDTLGNHTGPRADGNGIEYGIPNVPYDRINGSSYTFLPYPQGGGALPVYRVVTTLADQDTSAYDFYVAEQNENGTTTAKYYWSDVPLVSGASNEVIINLASTTASLGEETSLEQPATSSPYIIRTDDNDDGVFEKSLSPTTALDANASADTLPPVTKSAVATSTATTTLTLFSTDDIAGVLATEISLDGGVTWAVYTGSLSVSAIATTTVQYFSTDRAGNAEEIQTVILSPVIVAMTPEKPVRNDNGSDAPPLVSEVSPAPSSNGPPIGAISFNQPIAFSPPIHPVLSMTQQPVIPQNQPNIERPIPKTESPIQSKAPSIKNAVVAVKEDRAEIPVLAESVAPAVSTSAPEPSALSAAVASNQNTPPTIIWVFSIAGGVGLFSFFGIKFLNKVK